MKRFSLLFLLWGLTLSVVHAQTLGSALTSVEHQVQQMLARTSGESWGVQTAADDLERLLAQTQRLAEALTLNDARKVEELQRGLSVAARRVKTSSVLLPTEELSGVEDMLATLEQVDQRLTGLRLRFGSRANLVAGSLSEVGLNQDEPGGEYTNLEDLLIDVRDARRLAETLGSVRFPRWGFEQRGMHNLDPLQLNRFVRAGWELERQLSGHLDDVSESLPAWDRFQREYDRLGYMGTGSQVRQLERVMERLSRFYSSGP